VDDLHTLSRDGGRCRQKDELDQVSRQCLRRFPIGDSESKKKLEEIIDDQSREFTDSIEREIDETLTY
jgi:hypothetical protein